MCPVCISTAALTIAGMGSSGGLTAFALRNVGAGRLRKLIGSAQVSARKVVSVLFCELGKLRAATLGTPTRDFAWGRNIEFLKGEMKNGSNG